MKKKHKIIFAAQDPGGFEAIQPVVEKIKKDVCFETFVLLAGEARRLAKERKIAHIDANRFGPSAIEALVERERPDLIFTATSSGLSIEKQITKIAKEPGIKTVALMDFWGNYRLRFSDPGTGNLNYLPDAILAIDRVMKQEMIKNGFESAKIFITGSPAFDNLGQRKKNPPAGKFIAFFCQPFSELARKGETVDQGFDEIGVLKDLVEVLGSLGVKLPVKIKLHPKAKISGKFSGIINQAKKLDVSLENKLSVADLIENSAIVTGMNSVILFKAALAGKKVLSYQPDRKGVDPLASNRLGLSQAVYTKEKLELALKKLILAKPQQKKRALVEKYTRNRSTEKVMRFIERFI